MSTWDEYDAWNEVLAEHFFSADFAGLPVYLDADEDTLIGVADELGVERSRAIDTLVGVVRPTLGLNPRKPLVEHARRFQDWRNSLARTSVQRTKGTFARLEPPPIAALLTVCVLAAQRIGSNQTTGAPAYYPHLRDVLGLHEADADALKRAFPATEAFWRGVNEYLDASEGRLGLPTAYALGRRYVGIPQSQVLVRATDRARLPDFFAEFGLIPGSEMVPADLERLLDGWIAQNPSPVSTQLVRLWKGQGARDRIAGVAAVELSLWDGSHRSVSTRDGAQSGGVGLTALMRQGFGSKSIELSFAARLAVPADVDELLITSAEGSPRISVVPAAGGRLRPTPGSRLDAASLVGAVVELTDPISSQKTSRRPRRVVPMRRDELLGALVEIDKIQLADDTIVLIKDDETLIKQATDLIRTYGRFGAIHRNNKGEGNSLPGLPDGWALLDDVQLFAIPQDVKRIDLHPLLPLTTARLDFAGGLKIPGRLRKWSSLRPPEIRAVVSEAESMTISLYDLSGEDRLLLEQWSEPTEAMTVSLEECELADGDYDVELAVRPSGSPKTETISQSTLRLRSADTPDAHSWETCTRLNYELDTPDSKAVTASPITGDSQIWVDGLNTVGTRSTTTATIPISDGIRWDTKRTASEAERPVVVLGVADPNSCVVTGAHRIDLPTWHGGKPTSSQIIGICRECGVRKSHPARPRWKQSGAAKAVEPNIEFQNLRAHPELAIDLDSCLDALVHVGGGTMNALERVASQVEGGALFLDGFVRTLESRGHIDVRYNTSLQPSEWEANPAYLGETIRNGFLMAGVWSNAARSILERHVSTYGGRLERILDDSGISAWFVRGLHHNAISTAVANSGLNVEVIPDAPQAMLDALPTLSEVEESLPRVPIPDYTRATFFDVARAKWVAIPGVAITGAYRIEQSFKTISIWVDRQGARDRTCRIGTVQLVKHLAARNAQKPLLGYLPSHSKLLAPLGGELPALYGRAAVLCSGLTPSISPATRTIGYHDVPREIADKLNTLFSN
ncbi:hypothetical protein [Ornithinimicrobium faecis]|uniref:hypothetical protein n=1 Tax=Ornithinimicrobium faecis TaxID=2934158 RepID=UPI002117AC5C|nr:hypothetical protein [Ornithinimicrobium sp. HY1745]